MPTLTTSYVVWESRGFRHKNGSGAVDITAPFPTGTTEGLKYGAYAFPEGTWTDVTGTHTGHFAFWSVVGAAGGPMFSTDTTVEVIAGPSDMQATAWYIEGGGNGGPALLIDAFDVDIGDFVLDDFVNVVSDASLTAEANLDGIVPTTAQSEDVRAYTSIRAVPFDQWIVVEGTEPVTAEDLDGTQDTSAIAFAMYQSPPGGVKVPSPNVGDVTWVSWGVTVDGGGHSGRGPIPPWSPFVRDLAAGLALADSAASVDQSLRSSVLRLAADQVQLAASKITQHMQGGELNSG
jgi:hypothetical protein